MQPSATADPADLTPSLWSSIATATASPGTTAPEPSASPTPTTPPRATHGGDLPRRRTRTPYGLRCPATPEHGRLIESNAGRLYCPHHDHDGRPATATGGALDRSPCYFTLDAAEAAQHEEDTRP